MARKRTTVTRPCYVCGCLLHVEEEREGICAHHTVEYGDPTSWSKSNRIQCDFFHRGKLRKAPRTVWYEGYDGLRYDD